MTITLTEAGTGTPPTLDPDTHPNLKFHARPDGIMTMAVNWPDGRQIFRVQEDIDALRQAISVGDLAA